MVPGLLALAALFLTSFAVLWATTLYGGLSFSIGPLLSFSSHSTERPLLVCVATLLAIVVLSQRASERNHRHVLTWQSAGFLLFLVFVAWKGLHVRHDPALHGDALEYVVQTQAIVFDHRLAIDPDRRRPYWNLTNPYGVRLSKTSPPAAHLSYETQAGGGFGGLYPDRFGSYRFYHFWLYPLSVAPLYLLCHWILPGSALEYDAFRVMNVVYLCLPFVMAWLRSPSFTLLIVCLLGIYSPLLPYTDWYHPELFSLSLVFGALWSVRSERFRVVAPLALGVAAAQVTPILVFFPLLLLSWLEVARPTTAKSYVVLAVSLLLGIAVAAAPLLYFKYYFGVFNVIQAVGLAHPRFASWSKAADIFASPMIGAVWFYPACFVFAALGVRRETGLFVIAAVLSMAAAAWVTSTTQNFNSAQIGALRYTVWLLGPLWFLALGAKHGTVTAHGRWSIAAFVCAIAINVACIRYVNLGRLVEKDISRFEATWRALPEVARLVRVLRYRDDIEVLVENICRRELLTPRSFNGIYVWNLGAGESLWVISERAAISRKDFHWPALRVPDYESVPPGVRPLRQSGTDVVLSEDIHDFADHPIVGRYVLLWVKDEVRDVSSDVPSCVQG